MLILLSKTQRLERILLEGSELLKCRRVIRKQEHLALRILAHLDATIIYAIVDPVWREAERLGDLRDRQIANHAPRVRLTPLLQDRCLSRMVLTVLGNTSSRIGERYP